MTNELISTKYTFACDPDECDVLIELTSSDGFGFPSGVMEITCPCGRKPVLLSVVNATIPTSNQTKEEKMENITIGSDALHSTAVPYNPDLLVTYKVIKGYSDPEYATSKVASLEWDLHNGRQSQKLAGTLESNINGVRNIITEAYADSQDQDTLREIAEMLSIELVREVLFTATLEVSGTYTYNILENDYDLDLDSDVTDALYADSSNGNITIDDTEVCHIREA
jgi:hypothetical protein